MKKLNICLTALISLYLLSSTTQAHEETIQGRQAVAIRSFSPMEQIRAREMVELTAAEKEAGVIAFRDFLPILEHVNRRYRVYSSRDFDYFIHNFHYPYRQRFNLQQTAPPTHVVLHWTANPRPDIPLYTFSAFLRRRQGGRIVERPNAYKNVSNYFLSGTLEQEKGRFEAYLVKLTRGDLRTWGDIPRVTAYPTKDAWDDNKYDGRGALGIEIDSPNFRNFYYNALQREKLRNFLILVFKERGVLHEFAALRNHPQWNNLCRLQAYLLNHLQEIDVQPNGKIDQQWQLLHSISRHLPGMTPETLQAAQQIFRFLSGHGVVAHEYNTRMLRAGRAREANYDKIDFTEPQVFLVAMDLLQSPLEYQEQDRDVGFDLATQRFIDAQKQRNLTLKHADLASLQGAEGELPILFYRPLAEELLPLRYQSR